MFFNKPIQEAKLDDLIPAYNSACDTLDDLELTAQTASQKFMTYIHSLEVAICKLLGNIFVTYKPHNTRYYILELKKDKLYSLVKFTNSYGYLEAHTCCTKSSIKECMVVCERRH